MRQTAADLNRIRLHGRVTDPPAFSHSNHGVDFYSFPLEVGRLSGAADRLNVVAAQPLLEGCPDLRPGDALAVRGEVRTFNNRTGVGSRLVISTFARELVAVEGEAENKLELSGTLCKAPGLRATPLGRTICDMILAVNRRYGRADYLPCIAWGSLAHRCAALSVGDRIWLHGRLQSRRYTKTVGEESRELTAFEVSVMSLADPESPGI